MHKLSGCVCSLLLSIQAPEVTVSISQMLLHDWISHSEVDERTGDEC
jgi:hypothetical protein